MIAPNEARVWAAGTQNDESYIPPMTYVAADRDDEGVGEAKTRIPVQDVGGRLRWLSEFSEDSGVPMKALIGLVYRRIQ